MYNTSSICRLLDNQKSVNGTKELIHQVFLADKNYIVRKPKEPYQSNELHWFISQSRNIEDLKSFAGFIPKIWEEISEVTGIVNSNYGWCCLSKENGNQFWNAMKHLELDKNSRRAIMIYNRPTMHEDWIANRGNNNLAWQYKKPEEYLKLRGDFMCCQNNHFLIRDDKLEMTVHMRSLDAVFGYNADYIWFDFIFNKAVQYLKKTYPELERGDMVIYADSVHVYERHYEDLHKEATYGAKDDSIVNIKRTVKHCNPYLLDPENNASVKELSSSDKFVIRQVISQMCNYTLGSKQDEKLIKLIEKNDDKPITLLVNDSNQTTLDKLNSQYGTNFVINKNDPIIKEYANKKNKNSVKPNDPMVNHPTHYNGNKIEHWDYVQDLGYDYLLGCATKYVFRNRHKGSQNQDLDKVLTYCDKFVNTVDYRKRRVTAENVYDYLELLEDLNKDEKTLLIHIDMLHRSENSMDATKAMEYINEYVQKLKKA